MCERKLKRQMDHVIQTEGKEGEVVLKFSFNVVLVL